MYLMFITENISRLYFDLKPLCPEIKKNGRRRKISVVDKRIVFSHFFFNHTFLGLFALITNSNHKREEREGVEMLWIFLFYDCQSPTDDDPNRAREITRGM